MNSLPMDEYFFLFLAIFFSESDILAKTNLKPYLSKYFKTTERCGFAVNTKDKIALAAGGIVSRVLKR